MMNAGHTEPVHRFIKFQERLNESFPKRADALTEVINVLSAGGSARSAAEATLNPLFTRQYGSLYDAVDNFFVPGNPQNAQAERREQQQIRMRIAASCCPAPSVRPYYLIGLDTTDIPRPFANTLEDRGVVYHPNPAPGNKPVAVGHSYSVMAAMPEKQDADPPWIIPISARRVPTDGNARQTGAAQLADLLTDEDLPFGSTLCAAVGDTVYSGRNFIGEVVAYDNLVPIVRVRGDRKFCRPAPETDSPAGKGHPKWYGCTFDLKDPSTWGQPDDSSVFPFTMKNGRECRVEGQAWHNLLMTGTREFPMHQHPFTLIRFTVKDTDGRAVFTRPLWLIIIGRRRHEITLSDAYHSYRQRYDMEHFFRFGKNRLLMAGYQSPDAVHEENWMELVLLAYLQLYMAAPLAVNLPMPWERWLPGLSENGLSENGDSVLPSPTMVQRNMPRIIGETDTPARPVIPRGKSPGRPKGSFPKARKIHPVIFKKKRHTADVRAP